MDTKCTIENTHKRLNEVHFLLHQMIDNYFNPESFRIYLNATIQALRNLTFALQNEKSKVGSGFDKWYEKVQENLKKDQIMHWINKSRVQIVHRGDLASKSLARVSIYSYDKYFLQDFIIPIELSFEDTLTFLIEQGVITPQIHKLKMIISIERGWYDELLPEMEVVSALVYGFEFLYQIVKDAHSKFSSDFDECSIKDTLHKCEFIKGELQCIDGFKKSRITEVSANDFQIREMAVKEVYQDFHKLDSEIYKRYNVGKLLKITHSMKFTMMQYFEVIIEEAKYILENDGYHVPLVFFMKGNTPIKLVQMELVDKESKYIGMNKIADELRSSEANGIITINESWISTDIMYFMENGTLESLDNKRECLFVSMISKDGIERHASIIFTRNHWGRIKFQNTVYSDNDIVNYLNPIKKVWAI